MRSSVVPATRSGSWRARWQRFSAAAPVPAWTGAVLAGFSIFLVLPILFDARQWQGVSTWLKPWKFSVSLAVQMLTMALLAQALAPAARRRNATRVWMAIAALTALFEATYMTAMAALNLGSHFNVSTPAFATMYQLMGVGALLLSFSGAALGIQIARFPRPSMTPALRWGLALALVAGWLLGTLTGAATDAGGLPLVGWSRTGGDLRPAHFLGVHATQGIALVAWVLQRERRGRRAGRSALTGTVLAAALWSLVTWLLYRQAVSGTSVFPY